MHRIRVLVVEDSVTVREAMIDILKEDPHFDLVGSTGEGSHAVELCKKFKPDVVTMDMILFGMNGLEATELIMAYCPTPILIVSSSVNRAEIFKTYDALAAGAVEVLDKPHSGMDEEWSHRFRRTLKLVSKIKVITHPRARLGTYRAPSIEPAPTPEARFTNEGPSYLAIGASTGGPAAIVSVLQGLGKNFPLPVFIVLHISSPFGQSFAEWLDSQSPLPVRFGKDGELLPKPGRGCVILAPPDVHMVVKEGLLRLTKDPERHSCRPSVDELFESLAREMGTKTVACLLTGMGKDGALGLLAIRKAGGATIAQDESSSLIFGMPREAIAIGGAERILSLSNIPSSVLHLTSYKKQKVSSLV